MIISETFLTSFSRMPKSIQKKTHEFIKKFKENSRSHAIHLEPISTFVDPNMRTARVDLAYRAIVHVNTSADACYLLWVDHHDEAMDWAKNKVFEWNGEVHKLQIYERPEAAVLPEPEPTETTFFEQFREKDLLRIGVPPALLPSVRALNNLDDLERIESYLPGGLFERLFELMDGGSIEEAVEEVARGKSEAADTEAQMDSANNRRHFVEVTDEILDKILSENFESWHVFLHESQRALVEADFRGPTKVSGGAGTGKTVAALHRVKYIQDNFLQPGERILFTTYTKSLTKNLREKLPLLGIDSNRVEVINLDAYVLRTAREKGLVTKDAAILDYPNSLESEYLWNRVLDREISSFDAGFLADEYRDVILHQNLVTATDYYRAARMGRKQRISRKDKVQIWRLKEAFEAEMHEENTYPAFWIYNRLYDQLKSQGAHPFAYVVADELQDFTDVQLRLLRVLAPEGPNDLFLVGDPLQKIYAGKIVFSHAGISVRGRRSRRLKVNYRTTEEIKRAALSTIHDVDFADFDGGTETRAGYVSLMHGDLPDYRVFTQKSQEIKYVIELIRGYRKQGMLSENIVIAARTSSGMKDFKSALHTEGIPYFDLTNKTGSQNGIRLSTFHNMKGLEFRVVFLVDVNERSVPLPLFGVADTVEQQEHTDRERSLVYVAMTRAIERVHVSGVGVKSGLIGI